MTCIWPTKRFSPEPRPRSRRFASSTVVHWAPANAGRSPKKSRRCSSTWSTAALRNTSTGSPPSTKAVPMSATQEGPIVQLQSSDLPAFCPNPAMRVAKPVLLSSPEECEQAFYEALEAGDSEAVVDLWLEDDDLVCIHPGC